MQARTKAYGAQDGVNHDIAHGPTLALAVGRDDDVDVLHDALEGLVELLGLQLQLQQGPVHLVHHQDGLDAFSDGLAQHSFCLHTHARHTVHHHQSSIGDTQGSCHL